ncbi:MAG: hypothetical protein A2Z83_05480 [Omnitrophica bacterium GWA2_52_8]|nr:MAG: hypothetical protein A2Z83_05480 [Omnitrophica bacterium GWA2_52_8]
MSELQEGLPVSFSREYAAKDLDLDFVDLKYLGKLTVTGTAEKQSDILHVYGKMTGRTEKTCARCAKETAEPIEKRLDLYLPVQDQNEIDIINELRENLVLDYEGPYTCGGADQEECQRTISRNLAQHSHEIPPKSPFDVLKKLRNIKKENH